MLPAHCSEQGCWHCDVAVLVYHRQGAGSVLAPHAVSIQHASWSHSIAWTFVLYLPWCLLVGAPSFCSSLQPGCKQCCELPVRLPLPSWQSSWIPSTCTKQKEPCSTFLQENVGVGGSWFSFYLIILWSHGSQWWVEITCFPPPFQIVDICAALLHELAMYLLLSAPKQEPLVFQANVFVAYKESVVLSLDFILLRYVRKSTNRGNELEAQRWSKCGPQERSCGSGMGRLHAWEARTGHRSPP